jgi:uncharacterized protein
MMQQLVVGLSAIPEEGISRSFVADKKALGITEPELFVAQPVRITCEFFRFGHEIIVQGSIRSAIRLTCGRCAEEFVLPLAVPVDAVYLPVHDVSSERAREIEAGATDVYAYVEQVLDLAEMVRDRLFLSIPLQPLCAVECKGLCPSCGMNRNVVQCQCAEVKLGSPFELLKGLRLS